MFGTLTKKFQDLKSFLYKEKTLTEDNLQEAVRSVRLALLDADVGYAIVSDFIKRVKEKALGALVTKGVDPRDQFIKIVHEELVALMGSAESVIHIKKPLHKILLVGLQGSGKTTQAAKLAFYFRKKYGLKPLLIALDYQRPAAVDQLHILGQAIDIKVFSIPGETSPIRVAKEALKQEGFDMMIFDTAGRLHIDDELMKELISLRDIIQPHDIFFVANAALGQEAVKVANEFNQKIEMTGSILSMLDGSTRAGAALSIFKVTQKPLLFEGIGEKADDLRLFNPHSMADRILGMGDIINLVKKAEEAFSKEEGEVLEKKLKKATFTFDDYLKQMKMMKKMGPLKGLLKMMPGMGDLPDLDQPEAEFKKIEAIILSMTPKERLGLVELVPSRRRRIAKGSGSHIDDVNRLIKNFKMLLKFMKDMPGLKKKFAVSGALEKLKGAFPGKDLEDI